MNLWRKTFCLTLANLKPLIRRRTNIFLLCSFPIVFATLYGWSLNAFSESQTDTNAYLDGLPSTIITMLMFTCFNGAGVAIAKERKSGLLTRLLLSPTHPVVIMYTKILFFMIIILIQTTLLFIVSRIFWGLTTNIATLFCILVVTVLISVIMTGFGVFFANLIRTPEATEYGGVIIIFSLLLIGGCWVPIYMLPEFVQSVAKGLPIFYAINILKQLILSAQGLGGIIFNVIILMIISVLFTFIGTTQFEWERRNG
ncbi:MAG: ABC transporter permease [bacterium]